MEAAPWSDGFGAEAGGLVVAIDLSECVGQVPLVESLVASSLTDGGLCTAVAATGVPETTQRIPVVPRRCSAQVELLQKPLAVSDRADRPALDRERERERARDLERELARMPAVRALHSFPRAVLSVSSYSCGTCGCPMYHSRCPHW